MQVVGSYEHRIGLVVGMPLPCVKLFIATHESLDCHVSRFHIAGNIEAMIEMYLAGVSIRRAEDVSEIL
jgi:hypothetical protein